MKFIKNIIFIKLSIIFIIFSLDRISKTYVINLFNETQFNEIYLLEFLNIYFIWNEGIAFGLFSFENKEIYNLITLIIIIINLVILYILFRLKDIRRIFFLIILGGSLGNLFDRLFYNAVPDFIDLHLGDLHWFIFNPADIFISIGVICLILDEFFFKNKKND